MSVSVAVRGSKGATVTSALLPSNASATRLFPARQTATRGEDAERADVDFAIRFEVEAPGDVGASFIAHVIDPHFAHVLGDDVLEIERPQMVEGVVPQIG